jgi:hypothetical protein
MSNAPDRSLTWRWDDPSGNIKITLLIININMNYRGKEA